MSVDETWEVFQQYCPSQEKFSSIVNLAGIEFSSQDVLLDAEGTIEKVAKLVDIFYAIFGEPEEMSKDKLGELLMEMLFTDLDRTTQ